MTRASTALPRALKQFFWDCAFSRLNWERDRDFVIGRLLERGDLRAMRWLRRKAGDSELRGWIEAHGGRGLSPRRLRYWELVLGLPHRRVSAWIEAQSDLPWANRLGA
jgi:hypothetical protein